MNTNSLIGHVPIQLCHSGCENLQELGRSGDTVYLKLEGASEVDRYRIAGLEEGDIQTGGFEFFRGLGIIGYGKTFKMWLRKFPRPIFIVAVKANNLISWVFIEEWDDVAYDGSSVWVLRAIETIVPLRKNKIGYRMLLLGAKNCVGYIITKALTEDATRFFKRAGFMEINEFRKSPVDLSHNPGYLILPPYRKKQMLEDLKKYFTTLNTPQDLF